MDPPLPKLKPRILRSIIIIWSSVAFEPSLCCVIFLNLIGSTCLIMIPFYFFCARKQKQNKNMTVRFLNDLFPWQHLFIDLASPHPQFVCHYSHFALSFLPSVRLPLVALSLLEHAGFHLSVVFCRGDGYAVGLC